MRYNSKQIQRIWNVSSSAKIRLGYKIVVNNEVNVLLDVVRTSDFFFPNAFKTFYRYVSLLRITQNFINENIVSISNKLLLKLELQTTCYTRISNQHLLIDHKYQVILFFMDKLCFI